MFFQKQLFFLQMLVFQLFFAIYQSILGLK